ncbi:MAG: hypothetical protein ACR2JT_05610 [Nocardioidaceae bacterium]
MSHSPRPAGTAPAATRFGHLVIALGLAGLAGCGTGFGAQTVQVYDAGAGVNARGGGVDVLNALIVANEDGTGTLSVSLLAKFGDGDELTTVDASDGPDQPIEVTQSVQPLPICSTRLTIVGPDAAVTFSGDFVDGQTVTLALTFADAAPVTMQVPVVARGDTDIYDSVAETPGADEPQQDCPPAASSAADQASYL